jgi:hypothetical protein
MALAIVILRGLHHRLFSVPEEWPMPARSLGSAAATDTFEELDAEISVIDAPTTVSAAPAPETVVTTRVKILAVASLLLWTVAITAGRLTAYGFYRGNLLKIWP